MMRFAPLAALPLTVLLAACGDKTATTTTAPDATAAQAAVAPAAGRRDWTTVVAPTPDGGFLMGNPNAPVKVVEYASLTCSHCADFSKEGVPALKADLIKSGRVSLELRNFVRDPLDLAAALLSRCGGVGPYFKLTEQMFADQEAMFKRAQAITPADQQRIAALPQGQQLAAYAQAGGLDQFVKVRGVPAAKANACLTDAAAQDKLTGIRQTAIDQYNLQGTPGFLINGRMVEATTWQALEPEIRKALG